MGHFFNRQLRFKGDTHRSVCVSLCIFQEDDIVHELEQLLFEFVVVLQLLW